MQYPATKIRNRFSKEIWTRVRSLIKRKIRKTNERRGSFKRTINENRSSIYGEINENRCQI
jgi:hypothetical protein